MTSRRDILFVFLLNPWCLKVKTPTRTAQRESMQIRRFKDVPCNDGRGSSCSVSRHLQSMRGFIGLLQKLTGDKVHITLACCWQFEDRHCRHSGLYLTLLYLRRTNNHEEIILIKICSTERYRSEQMWDPGLENDWGQFVEMNHLVNKILSGLRECMWCKINKIVILWLLWDWLDCHAHSNCV